MSGDALVVTMMRFADELADLEDFKFPSSQGIRKYTDEDRDNLMRVIQAKLKGRKPKLVARETPHQAEVVDLMARLRASLERKDEGRRTKDEKGKKTSKRKRVA